MPPLNWTYAPANTTRDLPYKFFDLTVRMGTEFSGMPGLKAGWKLTINTGRWLLRANG